MKAFFTILLILSTVLLASAQSIEKEVVAIAGNTTSNATHQLTCTVGEPIISFKSTTVSIDQGFLAGATNGETLSVEDLVVSQTVKIFPNPVIDIVTINIEDNTERVTATIYNISGKQVSIHNINTERQTLNLSHLASGMYLVQLYFKDSNTSKSFKILKK